MAGAERCPREAGGIIAKRRGGKILGTRRCFHRGREDGRRSLLHQCGVLRRAGDALSANVEDQPQLPAQCCSLLAGRGWSDGAACHEGHPAGGGALHFLRAWILVTRAEAGTAHEEVGVGDIRGTLFWGPYNKDPTI